MQRVTLKEHSQFDWKFWILETAGLLNGYSNANFHLYISIFEWEVHSVRHTCLIFTWPKLCNRLDINSWPVHLITSVNNGKTFLSLGGVQLPVFQPASFSTRAQANQKVLDFLRPSETLLENNPSNTRNKKGVSS